MNILFLSIGVASLLQLINAGKFANIDGFRYYISYPLKKNWYQAQRFCTYHGMYLIDIPTSEENQRVSKIVQVDDYKAEPFFWTSGADLGTEGNFYWATSGHPMLYHDWAPGQPDNNKNADHCTEIRGTFQYKWNDDNCLIEKYFICRDRVILPEIMSCSNQNYLSNIDVRSSFNDDMDKPKVSKRDITFL